MNTTSTTNTTDQPKNQQTTQQTCAKCGMPKEEWRGNNGAGFTMGDNTYCCQGCATDTGCTCD